MHKRLFSGRGVLMPTGLALIIASLWEISVRFDAMYPPIRMFFNMARGEGISFSAAMSYFDWSIFAMPIYLILCLLTGLLGVISAGHRVASAVLIVLSAVLAAYGLGRETSVFSGPWYLAQPALLLVLSFGGVLSLISCRPRRRRIQGQARRAVPADVPRLTDAPRLRSIRTDAKANAATQPRGDRRT